MKALARALLLLSLGFIQIKTICVSTHAQSATTNGLVALYSLNGNAADVLGSGNVGTLFNGAFFTNGIAGEPKSAVYCDGVNAYVFFGKNNDVYPNQILSWSVWFKAEAFQGIVFWDDDSLPGGDRSITVGSDGILYGGDQSYFVSSTAPVVKLNFWHHAVFTSDTIGQRLYLDGALIGSRSEIIQNHAGRSSVSIGAGNYSAGNPNSVYGDRFKGAISKVRIYSRALSSSEIQELYIAESPPCVPRRATATASVVNGFVVGAEVTDSGCGYDDQPLVLVQGGGGTGATAVATVSGGRVTKITITDAGSGYTTIPRLSIGSPPFLPWLETFVSKVKVTMHVMLGANYILESSTDLKTWNQIGTRFTAQEEVIGQEFDVDVTGRFYRIHEVP